MAATGNVFASQIVSDLELPVGVRRVQQILTSSPNLKFMKRIKKPALTRAHIAARLNWARMRANEDIDWSRVIFSDEKKFNLDGPDGFQYYWHDLRAEEQVYMSRNFGGGSVMVWGGFSSRGKLALAFISSRMKATDYVEVLAEHLLPRAHELVNENYIFQQDNAPINKARLTMSWFENHSIQVLDWPARSPDMNPIENLWGIIARRVYKNGRQFQSTGELKSAILDAWNEITPNCCERLCLGLKERVTELLICNGKNTKY